MKTAGAQLAGPTLSPRVPPDAPLATGAWPTGPLVLVPVGPSWPLASVGTPDGVLVIKPCASLADAYHLARGRPVDLLVVTPSTSAAELRALREEFPPTYGVLVRPVGEEGAAIARAVALRAEGYATLAEPLARVLIEMLDRSCPMPPVMRRWLLEHHPVPAQASVAFTAREEQVLRLLAAGQPNKAIARTLALSESSVKEYVKRILWKMGAKEPHRGRCPDLAGWALTLTLYSYKRLGSKEARW